MDSNQDLRFFMRARALVVLRLPFLAGASLLLSLPSSGVSLAPSSGFLSGSLCLAAASATLHAIWIRYLRARGRRALTFVSLAVDAFVFVVWAIETGGLRSPIFPIQLLLCGVSVLLFPRPAAALPAVGALAAIAWMERIDADGHLYDLTILTVYGSLHLVLTYLLTFFDRRERSLQKERDSLAEELGAAEERARLSREIHDGVGGTVAALVLQAQVLEGLCEAGPAREQGNLLLETSSEALEELRRSLRLLRGDFDLLATAKDHCLRLAKRTGLPIRLETKGESSDLPPDDQLSIFRVMQEALTNVVRHAKASSVEVALTLARDHSRLDVQDDGIGFERGPSRPGSYGLQGFEERARILGGELLVESEPGRGTLVRLWVPHTKKERHR